MTAYHWRKELLSPEEKATLTRILRERAPELLRLVEDVLDRRLMTDDEIEPMAAVLGDILTEEPYLSPRWLEADHLIGRVDSQAERFWR